MSIYDDLQTPLARFVVQTEAQYLIRKAAPQFMK